MGFLTGLSLLFRMLSLGGAQRIRAVALCLFSLAGSYGNGEMLAFSRIP